MKSIEGFVLKNNTNILKWKNFIYWKLEKYDFCDYTMI